MVFWRAEQRVTEKQPIIVMDMNSQRVIREALTNLFQQRTIFALQCHLEREVKLIKYHP
jgi:hypothetical protein